jgi:hypothetical protein
MLAWFDARIEAARPVPALGFERHAAALGDRADTDIIAINAPAFAVRIGAAAAGEFGHGPMTGG